MAGTSELNHEKREGSFHCANCGEKLFDSNTNMKVVQVGHLFINLYQMYLKLKQITY
jgi:peptide methionine sulfoxide reductase MsrB